MLLIQRHRLRGYDAMQLAASLPANDLLIAADLSAVTFVAANDDLVVAARAEELTAENPNRHP